MYITKKTYFFLHIISYVVGYNPDIQIYNFRTHFFRTDTIGMKQIIVYVGFRFDQDAHFSRGVDISTSVRNKSIIF